MGDPAALANSARGAVEAPAGTGKTQLIAKSVGLGTGQPQLVLTHTHAGVDALRRRLVKLGVPASRFRLHTIAGWALRYAAAYPGMSSLKDAQPRREQWNEVYAAAGRTIASKHIRDVITASYAGVYIDEYQDCTVPQHTLLLQLGDYLPIRVLGDPLQGIFDFREAPIDWMRDVAPHFSAIAGPCLPRRWAHTNPELGEWLRHARMRLSRGEELDLRCGCVRWIRLDDPEIQTQTAELFRAVDIDGSVVAIHGTGQRGAYVAGKLRGTYSVVEPLDAPDLHKTAEALHRESPAERATTLIEFLGKCATKMKPELTRTLDAIRDGSYRRFRKQRLGFDALRAVLDGGGSDALADVIDEARGIAGATVHRKDLLNEMCRALREHARSPDVDLPTAALRCRDRTRHTGRFLYQRCVGTTLLVKGLEFDHAIVLDAQDQRMTRKHLYVALTRGARSLTVLSRSPVLRPSA